MSRNLPSLSALLRRRIQVLLFESNGVSTQLFITVLHANTSLWCQTSIFSQGDFDVLGLVLCVTPFDFIIASSNPSLAH